MNSPRPLGPSELQKLYGSDLPPSLRWGATRRFDAAHEQTSAIAVASSSGPRQSRVEDVRTIHRDKQFALYRSRKKRPDYARPVEVGVLRREGGSPNAEQTVDIMVDEKRKASSRSPLGSGRPVHQMAEREGHDSASTIDVYNRNFQDQGRSPMPEYVPYPTSPRSNRASSRSPSHSRGRSRSGKRLGQNLADMVLENRSQARSRGRSDGPSFDRPPVGLAEWQLAQREAELRAFSREGQRNNARATSLPSPMSKYNKVNRRPHDLLIYSTVADRAHVKSHWGLAEGGDDSPTEDSESNVSLASRTSTQAGHRKVRFRALVFDTPQSSSTTACYTSLNRVVHASYGGIRKGNNKGIPKLRVTPRAGALDHEALFFYKHFQQKPLDFDKFKTAVLKIPELRKVRDEIETHLQTVQQNYEKLSQGGSPMRYMETFCHETAFKDGELDVLSICVPFLELQKHNHQSEGKLALPRFLDRWSGNIASPDDHTAFSTTSHSPRTLFQLLNPRNNTRRDLKQVICQMLAPTDRRFLNVSQTWMVIVNNELLLTCSTLAECELYGDLASPAPQEIPSRSDVRLETPDGCIWLLDPTDCTTYVDLASQFSDITADFADDFAVILDDKEVLPHEWQETVTRAKQSGLHIYLEPRRHKKQDNAERSLAYEETPLATSIHSKLNNKLLVRRARVSAEAPVSHETFSARKPSRSDGASVDDEIQGSATAASALAQASEDISRSKQVSDNSSDSGSSAKSEELAIPKSLVHAETLRRYNVRFEERIDDFLILDTLTDEQHDGLRKAVYSPVAAEELKIITRDALLVSCGAAQSSNSQQTVRSPLTDNLRTQAGIFHETLLYEHCCRSTTETYNRTWSQWCNEASLAATTAEPNSLEHGLDVVETDALCKALGYVFEEGRTSSGQVTIYAPMDGGLYADLLNGLRNTLSICAPAATDLDLQEAREKLLTAITGLIKTLGNTFWPVSTKTCIFALRKQVQSMQRLFNILKELELYEITQAVFRSNGGLALNDRHKILRHIVLALLIAANAITDLESLFPDVEAVIWRVGTFEQQSFYEVVQSCCEYISAKVSTTLKEQGGTELERAVLAKAFDEDVDRLCKRGWKPEVTRGVLHNAYRWHRVKYHADTAGELLLQGFRAILRADEARKIKYKAAALPVDVMGLILPQLLWRPVLGIREAPDMYNQYVTDLETNILTGDPSREPLDRIRILWHELNAFSQLQQQQIDLLERLNRMLFPTNPDRKASYHVRTQDPHPRRLVFEELTSRTGTQNVLIQELSGMLKGLQTEAQAQVLGIQDWRDNAVVGFAAITIIFLPLSFVASVFGMNTSDIRNLGQNQWVFWATAIPFTILVLSITGYFIDLPPLYWRRQERMTATTTTTPQGSLRQPDPSSQLERLLAAVHQKQATAMPAHIDTSQRLAMMKNESYLAVEEID